ncbi:MAG TPA: anti-sigma factor [Pseudonocardiaceae bacterium]|nr:anti-sigma factor [Pseudonocardiaceae bacterium]
MEVRIPADLSQLYVLRSLAATLALREDFDLDEVEDVKLAVDEMCSALVLRARAGEYLTCQFETAPRSVGVLASVPSDNSRPIEQDTFGWRVLGALTDQVTTWVTPGRKAPYEVHIRMTAEAEGY